MTKVACCEQEKYISEINGMMAFCHAHRIKYTGPPFKFCPFCGQVLDWDNDEDNKKSILQAIKRGA